MRVLRAGSFKVYLLRVLGLGSSYMVRCPLKDFVSLPGLYEGLLWGLGFFEGV